MAGNANWFARIDVCFPWVCCHSEMRSECLLWVDWTQWRTAAFRYRNSMTAFRRWIWRADGRQIT